MKVLVTGATGYIGGRLVARLLDRGVEVRCITRDPTRLDFAPWRDQVEVVAADAHYEPTLVPALEGCDVAYYLIHAMGDAGRDYLTEDQRSASNFRDAAEKVGVKRIVYLGALGSAHDDLSVHLQSRQEVGRILASGSTPVTEYRAAVIIGSGSVSFETIRHLTELFPVMFRPRWVRTRCQPIAVRDVLNILTAALDDDGTESHIYEIGGPQVLTYEEMMYTYAEVAGLIRRIVIPFPLFSVRLAPRSIGLLTPLPETVIRPLIESLTNDVVVRNESPPGFEPESLYTYRKAVGQALRRTNEEHVETRWSDAVTQPALPLPGDPSWSGATMKLDHRMVESTASPDDMFWAVSRIGGDVGYYWMDIAWHFRGWLDAMIGGVGLRRGRRHPQELRAGEAVDFFRVAEIDPEHGRLTLQAEMKVPGTAWLSWEIEAKEDGGSILTQSARFVPRGLFGRIYWWSLLPFHTPVFRGMARRIADTAEHKIRIQLRA